MQGKHSDTLKINSSHQSAVQSSEAYATVLLKQPSFNSSTGPFIKSLLNTYYGSSSIGTEMNPALKELMGFF